MLVKNEMKIRLNEETFHFIFFDRTYSQGSSSSGINYIFFERYNLGPNINGLIYLVSLAFNAKNLLKVYYTLTY